MDGTYCINCGYDLRGGEAEGVCPECGKTYSLLDTSSITTSPLRTKVRNLITICIAIGATVSIFLLISIFVSFFGYIIIDNAYERAASSATRQDVENAIGLLPHKKITITQAMANDPAYVDAPIQGDIYRCGFGLYYFYVVYENDKVMQVIPAYE